MRELGKVSTGDLVVVSGAHEPHLAKVERLTPTCAVVSGIKFKLDTGYQVGGNGWRRNYISTSPEDFLRARQHAATNGLGSFKFSRDGVDRARAAADYAEKVLREMGEWE